MQLPYPESSPTSPKSPQYDLPLHERLTRDFPSTPPLSGPSRTPPSPSNRALPDLQPPKPHFARSTSGSSSRSGAISPIRSSPLRQEVTDDEAEARRASGSGGSRKPSVVDLGSEADGDNENDTIGQMREGFGQAREKKKSGKRFSFKMMSKITGGMLSPPTSPETAARGEKSFRVDTVDRSASGVLAPPIVLPPPDYSRSSSRSSVRSSRSGRSDRSSSNQHKYGQGDFLVAEAYEGKTPSIRSTSSMNSLNSKALPPPPARSLWGDVTPPASPPISPPAVLGQRDRGVSGSGSDADSEGLGASSSAPKFSRSALKKSGVLMPISVKEASRTGSMSPTPLSSPGSPARPLSPSESIPGLRRKTSSNSINSLGSLRNLHDKLASLSGTMMSSGMFEKTEEGENQSAVARPKLDDFRSVSSQSVNSVTSYASFATAKEEPTVVVTPPPELNNSDGTRLPDSNIDDQTDSLAPTTSHASGSEDHQAFSESSHAQSVVTHAQSDGVLERSGDVRLGLGGTQKKRKGFGRFFKALGLSKVDEAAGSRRFSG